MATRKTHCKISLFLLLFFHFYLAAGQFAPQAGLPGSTAIPANSPLFKYWANSAIVQRGYLNIADTNFTINNSNRTSFGDSQNALGQADTIGVVSLGDKGMITLSFPVDIADGPGWDFAVFENGFRCPTDSNLAFLELAFVEVSSDGIHFYRFPAISLTPTQTQVSGFDFLDARKIHNLAGKYIAGYGTPFDLNDLPQAPFLDKNHVKFVRIIDVGGCIDPQLASFDTQGNIINDPFPTPYQTGGFDIDAVGVINFSLPKKNIKLFPIPTENYLNIASTNLMQQILIISPNGQILNKTVINSNFVKIYVGNLKIGLYFCLIKTNDSIIFERFIKM